VGISRAFIGASSAFAQRRSSAKSAGSVASAGVGATFFVSITWRTSSFDQSSAADGRRRACSIGSNASAMGRTASEPRSTIMYSSSMP
jgi:hypothetical protein